MNRKTKAKVTMRCSVCGSDDVSRTAEATWNKRRQCWQLAAVYDDATCNVCGGETSLIESTARNARDVAAELETRAYIDEVTQ